MASSRALALAAVLLYLGSMKEALSRGPRACWVYILRALELAAILFYHGSTEAPSRLHHGSFKALSRLYEDCKKPLSRVYQCCMNALSTLDQGCIIKAVLLKLAPDTVLVVGDFDIPTLVHHTKRGRRGGSRRLRGNGRAKCVCGMSATAVPCH